MKGDECVFQLHLLLCTSLYTYNDIKVNNINNLQVSFYKRIHIPLSVIIPFYKIAVSIKY